MSRMMIMAGGTGGHVMPALSVAKELIDKGVEVSWIGASHSLEARLVSEANIEFDQIDIKGLRKSGWRRKLLMPFMLFKAILQTFILVLKRKPDAMLGMGGFVSGPGGLVAAAMRLPLILHEQNAVAGLTNKWLAKFSNRVFSGFPSAQGIDQTEWTGNPVRAEITQISDPTMRLQHREGPLRILVIGGSQGARVFNDELPRLLTGETIPELDVWHQSGRDGETGIGAAYVEAGIPNKVNEFIDDMSAAYQWCDVVVCRSGAMTVSEVCCAGVVGIFIPYPHAVNDHQALNADYLVSRDAAFMVRQEEFVKGEWTKILTTLHADRNKIMKMAQRARQLSKPDAADHVAQKCMEAMYA